MLDTIGETAVRMTTRTDNNLTVENKDIVLKKIEKDVEERPIESSQGNTKTESYTERKNSGYNVDEGGIYFEKYDKKGNVILRIPPEQKPIDERA
jgi:putative salt-induced outer membrane protein YdiY